MHGLATICHEARKGGHSGSRRPTHRRASPLLDPDSESDFQSDSSGGPRMSDLPADGQVTSATAQQGAAGGTEPGTSPPATDLPAAWGNRVESRRNAVAAGSGSRRLPAAFAFGPVPHSDPPAGSRSIAPSPRLPAAGSSRSTRSPSSSTRLRPWLPAPPSLRRTSRREGGWGNVSTSRQAHDGTVVTDGQSPSPRVQYAFEDGASGGAARFVRLDSVIYPGGGRTIRYNCGSTPGFVVCPSGHIPDGHR